MGYISFVTKLKNIVFHVEHKKWFVICDPESLNSIPAILVALGVLDLPLCEIKVSKLNKVVGDFKDDCCSSLENEHTLAIEMKKHFIEAASKRCSSNLCLAAII